MYRTAIRAVIGLVVVLDALTACGEAQPTNTPIPQPTATPTAAPEPAPPEPAATEPIEPEAEQSHLSKPGRFALFNQVWELVRDLSLIHI